MVGAREIPAYAMLLVITGTMLMIGYYVIVQVYGAIPVASSTTTLNYSYSNVTTSLGTLAQWLPIIAIVISAAIILYLIVHALGGQ